MGVWTPRSQLALSGAAAALAAWLLLRFPPVVYRFYPACPIRAITGYECPGCGLTRALAALVAGRFREAADFNLLVVALAPAVLAIVCAQAYQVVRHNRWYALRVPRATIAMLFALTAVFGVARNLLR